MIGSKDGGKSAAGSWRATGLYRINNRRRIKRGSLWQHRCGDHHIGRCNGEYGGQRPDRFRHLHRGAIPVRFLGGGAVVAMARAVLRVSRGCRCRLRRREHPVAMRGQARDENCKRISRHYHACYTFRRSHRLSFLRGKVKKNLPWMRNRHCRALAAAFLPRFVGAKPRPPSHQYLRDRIGRLSRSSSSCTNRFAGSRFHCRRGVAAVGNDMAGDVVRSFMIARSSRRKRPHLWIRV